MVSTRICARALAAAAMLACAASGWSATDAAYTVQAGDLLSVSVWREPTLQSPVTVRPDGGFSFPLVGEVDARGKTVADLQKLMTERLKRYISDPVVSVSVQEVKGSKIYVIGQVNRPGDFVLSHTTNVMQAMAMAGGPTAFASLGDVKVLRRQGEAQISLPFHYSDVVRGKDLSQNVDLQPGDVVVVP
jgi:polysaccharide export outer membrane protein